MDSHDPHLADPALAESHPTDPALAGQPVAPLPAVMQVPNDIAGLVPMPPWTADDYQLFSSGDSTRKLISSAVAPLVAAARGYRHVPEATAATARGCGIDGLTGANGSRFRKLVGTEGVLYMPWFRPAVARREPTGRPGASAHQFRPVNPLFNDKAGKVAKYEFLAGYPTVLDIHPATPGDWLEHTAFALVTEGILKGDSGMTGMLLSAGITHEELRYDDETVDALSTLRALLKRVPEADRTMILSFGGVGNWHAHAEWSDFNLKHRTVLIAFDGDMATNPNVHKQGAALWQKLEHMGSSPKLLNLNVVTATAFGVESNKLGLDDYLATIGPWDSLSDRIQDALPPAPDGADDEDFRAGDWRMNEEACIAEELRELKGEGGQSQKTWAGKTRFIGRVARTLSVRVATDEEIRDGVLAPDSQAESDTTIEIQTKWREGDGTRTAMIIGPDTMLADAPPMWASRSGGRIPTDMLMHRDWPPAPEWVAGAKWHRREDTVVSTQWGHMGWVPVDQGAPVFIIGRQVLNRYGDKCKAATPGVTEKELAGATKFGVRSPASEDELKAALLKVWRLYRGGAWTDKRVAALALAAALRPVVPIPCRNAILVSGARGLGKSWLAGAAMAFWQQQVHTWDNNSLPGSAEDTMAATEGALFRTPIWVVDDWSPQADPRKAAQDSTKLGLLVRAIHNHTGKRRMTQTMGSRDVLQPRALLIITAEHEHTVGSVSDRLIHVPIVAGSLGTVAQTEAIVQMWHNTGEPSVVTGGAIALLAAAPDWAQAYRDWVGEAGAVKAQALKHMAVGVKPENAERHVSMAADLALGLKMWQKLFDHFGLDDEADQAVDATEDLFSLCRDHMISQKETTPGSALIKALRATLSAGNAHIDSVDNPGCPPISNHPASAQLNQMLGWSMSPEGPRPGGPSIGTLVYPAGRNGLGDKGDPVLLLHQTNAFNVAKKNHPDLILSGSQPGATWESTWTEGYCSTRWHRKKTSTDRQMVIIRKRFAGVQLEGVPVNMASLLDITMTQDDQDDQDEQD